jgi:hypothetical protein
MTDNYYKNITLSILLLLSQLTFWIIFDCSSYSKYLLQYIILQVMVEIYLVIKQIIIKYIITF